MIQRRIVKVKCLPVDLGTFRKFFDRYFGILVFIHHFLECISDQIFIFYKSKIVFFWLFHL